MNQSDFNQMLHAEEMPVCAKCTVLLKNWAESDPRMGQDHGAWLAFVLHRQSCRATAGLLADFYAHPTDIPGEHKAHVPGNLFMISEDFTELEHSDSRSLKAA